jgi:hypothetical protein
MKYFIAFSVLLFLAATSYAGQKAISDTGDEVILNSDGTWEYADNGEKTNDKIETNENDFEKSKDASFQLKSTKNDSTYWINTDKWSFTKVKNEGAKEYNFLLKGKDVYGMSISEGFEVDLESLIDIALTNAKNVAPNTKIVSKEYRMVNDKKVIFMQMNGTIQSIDFSFFGYYYSDSSGSTQFVTYTATKLVNRYKSEIFEFLNGFDTQ